MQKNHFYLIFNLLAESLFAYGATLCTVHRITGQEKSAIQRILDGKNNVEIANELYISKHTVTKHISNVFRKL